MEFEYHLEHPYSKGRIFFVTLVTVLVYVVAVTGGVVGLGMILGGVHCCSSVGAIVLVAVDVRPLLSTTTSVANSISDSSSNLG